jgi:hypothetical protein
VPFAISFITAPAGRVRTPIDHRSIAHIFPFLQFAVIAQLLAKGQRSPGKKRYLRLPWVSPSSALEI